MAHAQACTKVITATPKGFFYFSTPILKSLVIHEIWLAPNSAIYSQIAPFFALNRILFLSPSKFKTGFPEVNIK